MKKFLLILFLGFITLTLTGCNPGEVLDDTNPVTETQDVIVSDDVITVSFNDVQFDLKDHVSIPENTKGYGVENLSIDYGNYNVRSLGDYEVLLSVIGTDGIVESKTITLRVADTEAPTVEMLGEQQISITLGSAYVETGVLLTDNYDAILQLVTVGQVDSTTAGEYTLEYYTVDSSGNVSNSIYRTVIVVEGETYEIDEFGYYVSKDEVALYIYIYNKLPDNYMTKSEAGSHISNYWTSTNMASIGGDRFYNREGLLPEGSGRTYIEVDINYFGGSRGAERIVYSSDGFIFYTSDHYESFKLYDPETKEWVNYSKYDSMFD